MDSNFNAELGRSIRAFRKALGLSAIEVAGLSRGLITPVALSTYERGTRTISVARLAKLAQIYKVPLDSLVPSAASPPVSSGMVRLDIRRLSDLEDVQLRPLTRWARTVISGRSPADPKILTLPIDQLEQIAVLNNTEPSELLRKLQACGVMSDAPAQREPAYSR